MHRSLLTRRGMFGGFASAAALTALPAQASEEPKSLHTWFENPPSEIYAVDVDVKVDLPNQLDPRWLYFASLQVNFEQHNEWGHGGLQWASGGRKVNWGGGSSTGYGVALDGGQSRIVQDFGWANSRWYRYRVWRVDKDNTGYNRWLFSVADYETGQEWQIGTIRTASDWIKQAVVFFETGYGVTCATPTATADWRSPVYRSASGDIEPTRGVATYNGTCSGALNTNQKRTSSNPLQWRHSTGVPRSTESYGAVWG